MYVVSQHLRVLHGSSNMGLALPHRPRLHDTQEAQPLLLEHAHLHVGHRRQSAGTRAERHDRVDGVAGV
jgi:hypothetical protein